MGPVNPLYLKVFIAMVSSCRPKCSVGLNLALVRAGLLKN